jgi:hypothetical protein
LRFVYATDPDPNFVGLKLDALQDLRTKADYHRAVPGPFATAARAVRAVTDADAGAAALVRIEADPKKVAAIIADIQARWP